MHYDEAIYLLRSGAKPVGVYELIISDGIGALELTDCFTKIATLSFFAMTS
jgi:hypothetical protein